MSVLSELPMTEKIKIEKNRKYATKESLDRERELVRQGKGTRDWTPEQQADILQGYRPKDANGVSYEGHHMMSVSEYPQYAGDVNNIQWLSYDEHLYGAHRSNTHFPTNGYYDPVTGIITPFENEPVAPKVIELSNPVEIAQDTTVSIINGIDKAGEILLG